MGCTGRVNLGLMVANFFKAGIANANWGPRVRIWYLIMMNISEKYYAVWKETNNGSFAGTVGAKSSPTTAAMVAARAHQPKGERFPAARTLLFQLENRSSNFMRIPEKW